jgi:hypothetical protein
MEKHENIIQSLLISQPTKIIRIDSTDDYSKRYETLTFLTTEERKYITEFIFSDIIDRFGSNETFPVNTTLFFSCPKELNLTKDDLCRRTHSDDWCLIVFEDDEGNKIFDFCGWPGDNENGVVFLISRDKIIKIFKAQDTYLDFCTNSSETMSKEQICIMKKYQKKRFQLIYDVEDVY